MAITFPLASPLQWGVGAVTWQPRDNTQRGRNPFTLELITQIFDGRMWQGSITLAPQTEAEGRRLSAWLTSLRHPGTDSGKFLFEGPAVNGPLGSAGTTPGTPLVNGASQTGSSLDIDGLPVSATDYLKAGDFVQIGTGVSARLLMVLEDVDTDSGGAATLTVWPPIRTAPADGSAVVVDGAQGCFVANGSAWDVAPGYYPAVTLDVQEVF